MSERPQWDKDGIDWPHRGASRFVAAVGLTWHVQRMGRGPCLVLIHGTAASTHSWAGLIPLLQEHYEVIAFDLPGHAFTASLPAREMSLSGIAGRISALLHVLEVKPVAIIGHSAGAALAIRMVLDTVVEPPRQIISLNGALLPFPGVAGWLFPALAKMLVVGPFATELFTWRATHPGAVARIIRGTGSPVDPASLVFYERLMRHRSHVRAALDMMVQWDLQQLARDLPRLAVPLTLVAGASDLAVPPDVAIQTRAIVPGAEVRLERGLGHLAHEECPQRIAAIIAAVLPAHQK